MKIIVQSLHFDADKKLLDMIQKKYEKLDSYFDRIIQVDVVLKINKALDSTNKMVESKISIPGNLVLSKLHCATFEEAVDGSVDNLSKQLVRHKEKMTQNDHRPVEREI